MDTGEITITIDSLSYGGRGVGRRQDGKVVFVPMALPGEQVRVRVEKEHGSYCIAGAPAVLRTSPHRVEPECGRFSHCGGCDWQHLAYPEQVRWKSVILRDEITKTGYLKIPEQFQAVPSEMGYGYRGHATFQCSYEPDFSLGFFRKGTNRIIDIDSCPVLKPRVREIASGVRDILRKNPIPGLYSIEIHSPQDESILQARCRRNVHRNAAGIMERIYRELDISGLSFVVSGVRRSDHVFGQRFCRYSLNVHGRKIHLSCSFGDFIQANMQLNTALVEHVVDLAGGAVKVLDLYGGSGNFSIPLSLAASEVVSIERSSKLASLGNISAKKNRVGNVKFLAMDALKAVTSIRDEAVGFDTVVLDPPREGAKEVVQIIPDLQPSRIIYISCNPSTLARDLATLCRTGFVLKQLMMFDMFPQTFHIESVAYLER